MPKLMERLERFKKDYIDHMVFMKYYGDVVKSMNEFKNDLLHYYDKTNK